MANCILCDSTLELFKTIGNESIYNCRCPNCGDYEISSDAFEDLPAEFEKKLLGTRHLISGYVFEYQPTVRILNSNINDIVKIAKQKATLEHKMDRLLFHIYTYSDYYGMNVEVNKNKTAICYAKNKEEVHNLCAALKEMGHIDLDFYGQNFARCTLRAKGYSYIDEKTKISFKNKRCFVAMWFDEAILDRVAPYIIDAIVKTGFEPFISRDQEHNDDICDSIVAGINNSRLLIADFTGQRPSVYFEAGMAMGLGIPVIWTCREDWFNNQVIIKKEVTLNGKKESVDLCDEGHVHFDVNHYKFIVWKNGEDLCKKLIDRIEATLK